MAIYYVALYRDADSYNVRGTLWSIALPHHHKTCALSRCEANSLSDLKSIMFKVLANRCASLVFCRVMMYVDRRPEMVLSVHSKSVSKTQVKRRRASETRARSTHLGT